MSTTLEGFDVEDMKVVDDNTLIVDGDLFEVDYPDEPLYVVDHGRIRTMFRGHLENVWHPCDIEGRFV